MVINKKNNQAKDHFSYKNDERELVDIGQFIRDTTDFRVEREWYIIFDMMSGKYLGYSKTFNGNHNRHPRNPDFILIDKKTNKLLLVIEIDGNIHYKKMNDTYDRNNEYDFAGIPLIVIDKSEIETNIFDLVNSKIGEYFGKKD